MECIFINNTSYICQVLRISFSKIGLVYFFKQRPFQTRTNLGCTPPFDINHVSPYQHEYINDIIYISMISHMYQSDATDIIKRSPMHCVGKHIPILQVCTIIYSIIRYNTATRAHHSNKGTTLTATRAQH